MIKKLNIKSPIFNQSIFYSILISAIYFSYIFIIANINGDWRHYIDSEILWPYNTLLILSGDQIDFSAYGYFYFILETKFFQILDFIGLLKTTNIENLNNSENFSEKLENLIFAGRWFNVTIVYLTILIAFLIFKDLIKTSSYAFLLTLIFMFTPGMIQQMSHARIDILASSLLFISYFYLVKFSEKKSNIFFILFIIFFFLSVLTKVQSYIFLFALLISSIYFVKNYEENLKYNSLNLWFKIFLIVFIFYCIFYPIVFHRHAKFSLLFIYSQLFIINLYIYYVFKSNKEFLERSLILTASIFLIILTFILVLNNLPYMYVHTVRLTFFEPMEMRIYIGVGESFKGPDVLTTDLKKNIIYLFSLFKEIMLSFKKVFIYIFTKFNSITLLTILNLIIIFYMYIIKKNKYDLLLFFPILSFFLINSVNSIRGSGIELYLTYSEFLLFIPICVYLKNASQILKKYILISLIFILLLPPIINPSEYNSKRFVKTDRFVIWCPQFLDDYTNKISQKKIKEICY